jgi:hemophore-related protein
MSMSSCRRSAQAAQAVAVVVSVRVSPESLITNETKESHMFFRSLIGAGMIAGSMLAGTAATAAADPPNCTAADLASVMSGVNAGMSSYLFTHPDVNAFFTGLKGKSRDEMRTEITNYFDANPQVQDEISGVRQPASDFRDRCNAPVPDGPMG